MCGICGIYAANAFTPADTESLDAMTKALEHRGPDDSGNAVWARCGIAMRRLAIIDLQTGHQPLENEDRSVAVVLNGEIYNYRELRASLLSKGHKFVTKSDTEVVLRLYEEFGVAAFEKLSGMFAVAIHDRRRDHLILGRDRFGEKPLFYWASATGHFAFSSELRSLLQFREIPRKMSIAAVNQYLQFGFVPSPLTMFDGVRQLPPAHYLILANREVKIAPYYEPAAANDVVCEDIDTAAELVREALIRAVRRQMVSDVPIGAFLSGGIDSSSVVAAMQRISDQPIQTFTVRFEHAPYDESRIARAVAQHLGTDHHELVISNSGFDEDDLWRIVEHVGQPFADSSAIPTFHVSRLVAQHVKVCLSGDGGDEVFGGYPFFRWVLAADRLARFTPRPALSIAGAQLRKVGSVPGLRRVSGIRKAWRGIEAARQPEHLRALQIYQLFDGPARKQILSHAAYRELTSGMPERGTRLRSLMAFRMETVLPDDMLVKVDRMSMAASLEVRAPMLDPELVNLSYALPDRMLIRRGVGKYVLRRAVAEWLPKEVFTHPKMGFSIPLHKFKNARYAQLCKELLLEDRSSPMNDLFDEHALRLVVNRGLGTDVDHSDVSVYRASHQLWAMLQLAAWFTKFQAAI